MDDKYILLYHYDHDGDIVFDGLTTSNLSVDIMKEHLKSEYYIYTDKVGIIDDKIPKIIRLSNMKFRYIKVYNGFRKTGCDETIICPFNEFNGKKYDGVCSQNFMYYIQFQITKIIDDLDESTIKEADKYIHEIYCNICDSLNPLSPNIIKETEKVVNQMDLIMNNGIKEKIRKEEEEKQRKKDLSLMKELINKYGIPEEYLNEVKKDEK